jgi:Na+/proline symporter
MNLTPRTIVWVRRTFFLIAALNFVSFVFAPTPEKSLFAAISFAINFGCGLLFTESKNA